MKISAVTSSRVSGACLLLASGACVIILAGCASPRQAGRSQTAPVPPTAETPQQPSTAEFVTQTGDKREGMASWYGREFHGKPTASGEPYNMFALTCAHREYPLGTKLRVVHLANGQDVECIVNDRGPFVSNRELDMSYAAAKKIGLIGPGVSRVSMQQLGRYTRYVKAIEYGAIGAGAVTIQVGSFREEANALRLRKGLEIRYHGVFITQATIGKTKYYRVRIGKYKKVDEATATGKQLADEWYSVLVTKY